MKIIDDLLRIKTHRENQAESKLAQANRALQATIEAVQVAQGRLAQAHADHDARERALYEDLFSRLVQRSDLDLARAELETMHVVIRDCESALHTAENDRAKAAEKREEMRLLYRDAFRVREKYSELSLQARIERRRLEQHKEDMELEDVVIRRPDDEAAVQEIRTETAA